MITPTKTHNVKTLPADAVFCLTFLRTKVKELLALCDQQCKTQQYWVYSHIKQRKPANHQNWGWNLRMICVKISQVSISALCSMKFQQNDSADRWITWLVADLPWILILLISFSVAESHCFHSAWINSLPSWLTKIWNLNFCQWW